MSGICGICQFDRDSRTLPQRQTACRMGEALGSEEERRELWQGEHCLLVRRGAPGSRGQGVPPALFRDGRELALVYHGHLHNARPLAGELEGLGARLRGREDGEIVLWALALWGEKALERLEGPFALAFWDGGAERLLCARDPLGEIPLLYARREGVFLFSTSPAPLFAYPGMDPALSPEGLCQLLGIGPARVPGSGLFSGVDELPPGCSVTLSREGQAIAPYWRLEARVHPEDPEATVRQVAELAAQGVERCMEEESPLTVLLSGGLGSSLVAALAAQARIRRGEPPVETLSLQAPGREEQPLSPAQCLAGILHTSHRDLEWDASALAGLLEEAGTMDGLPGLGGADALWLYLCRRSTPRGGRLLTGSWTRAVFEDLPWSRWENAPSPLPWCPDLGARRRLFRPEVWQALDVEAYLSKARDASLARCPILEGEPAWERRRREAGWLTLEWWMAPALAAEGRMAQAAGVSLCRPLCQRPLLEYAWNIPHGMKALNGRGRGLLLGAARPLLPTQPARRAPRKPELPAGSLYAQLVGARLAALLDDPSAPLLRLADPQALRRELLESVDSGPWGWPGRGDGRVQLMGWLIQLNALLRLYPAAL